MGVSLTNKIFLLDYRTLPHTRGGVPTQKKGGKKDDNSSPHTWGCPSRSAFILRSFHLFPTHVGVSPHQTLQKSKTLSLPHTRGGVPLCKTRLTIRNLSSPHTWGCPLERLKSPPALRLFPTHVGVSLPEKIRGQTMKALPHTRGGVPIQNGKLLCMGFSSPHTWGCPSLHLPWFLTPQLFPTHVGVSPSSVQIGIPRGLFPTHVGVSLQNHGQTRFPVGSSPHTWGCPFKQMSGTRIYGLFPTHVGVSLSSSIGKSLSSPLPHTRGGVPGTSIELNVISAIIRSYTKPVFGIPGFMPLNTLGLNSILKAGIGYFNVAARLFSLLYLIPSLQQYPPTGCKKIAYFQITEHSNQTELRKHFLKLLSSNSYYKTASE